MNLPAGTDGGTITNPQEEGLIPYLMAFRGAIEIETSEGHGFILTENGKLKAAYFKSGENTSRGKEALSYLMADSPESGSNQTFNLRKYSDDEFNRALTIANDENLLLPVPPPKPAVRREADPDPDPAMPVLLDENSLRKIASQPGVIAVSAFFEGFPVQSMGDADFEHVAALAEDLMRAGAKIAQEMKVGDLDQLILETAENKFIIAPCGDLFLCVFTTSDAQLGLIRVVLKSIQAEIAV
ncbi:MAG: dynein regulation protein LC7 [Methanomicrobiales archaeon HGW-Methanomicrobiales-1]|jgi:predicted regulator of Ras-like GTPase activity (Roadblock/LC7/MglB family)|nr:MAG: dynein regulation protein LC7 [Methanomicrobiales archaeon HGW-Methanomicrobiales-1]